MSKSAPIRLTHPLHQNRKVRPRFARRQIYRHECPRWYRRSLSNFPTRRRHTFGLYTWITAALARPAFFLKGAAFYVFLFAILLWTELVAWKLVKDT